MVGQNNRDGQRNVNMTNLGYVPPTVHEYSPRSDGLVLHTRDPDTDTDIRLYDDGRDMHMVGNQPEA